MKDRAGPAKFIGARTQLRDTMARFDLTNIDATASGPVVVLVAQCDVLSDRFQLLAGESVIGRDPGCDVVVAADQVSRRHARVEVGDAAVRVRDLDSSNGTYVNGTLVESAELRDGDILNVGQRVRFVVAVRGLEPTHASPPPVPETEHWQSIEEPAPSEEPQPASPTPLRTRSSERAATEEATQAVDAIEPAPSSGGGPVVGPATAKVLDDERRQLAILLQVALRFLESARVDGALDVLFELLPRLEPFDAAFVAEHAGTIRQHPDGARLADDDCRQLLMEKVERPAVYEDAGHCRQVGNLEVRSQVVLPIGGGSLLCLLSRQPLAFGADMDYLSILAQVCATASAGGR